MNNIALKDIRWFYPYLEKFFPNEYFGKSGLVGETKPINHWDRDSFKECVQNFTDTKGRPIQLTIEKLRTWERDLLEGKAPEGNTPPKEVLEKTQDVEKAKSAYEAEQTKKQSLLESQKYQEQLLQAKQKEQTSKVEQVEQVAIQETFDTEGTVQRLPNAPVRTVITWASPYMDSTRSAAGELFVRGIRSDVLQEKFQGFQTERQKEITNLLSELKRYEEVFPGYLKAIKPLSPKDITLLSGADSGFNQAQVALMMRPLEEGGISVISRRGPLGFLRGMGQQLFGKTASKFLNKTLGSAATKAVTTAAKAGVSKAAATALGTTLGGPAGAAFTFISTEIIGKLKNWIQNNKEVFLGVMGVGAGLVVLAAGGPALVAFVPMALGGMSLLGSIAGGMKGIGKGVSGFWNTVLAGFSTVFFPSIGIPFLITALTLPVVIAIIAFVINSGAYIVPPGESLVTIPMGSGYGCEDAGELIYAPNSTYNLLPDANPARKQQLCITPTEIVVHWSGGWNGVMGTYNTLVGRGLACQFAIDEVTTLQMQQLWEKKVEWPACAGSHNDFSINIEMSGSCFSNCTGVASTPPPEAEIKKTVDLICWLKNQYDISTIIGHYEIPNSGKTDPGKDFLYKTLLPRIKAQCPN